MRERLLPGTRVRLCAISLATVELGIAKSRTDGISTAPSNGSGCFSTGRC